MAWGNESAAGGVGAAGHAANSNPGRTGGGRGGDPGRGGGGGDRNDPLNWQIGLTKDEVQEMIDAQGMSPARYDPWFEVINDIRTQVAEDSARVGATLEGGANTAFGNADMIGTAYNPAVQQNAGNAMGMQYLSPDQQAAMMRVVTDPNMSQEEKNAALLGFQNQARDIGVGEIRGNAAEILAAMQGREGEINAAYQGMGNEYYDRVRGQAMEDERRAIDASRADVSMASDINRRELRRMGFNPSQIAQLAVQNQNQEALNRVAGSNMAYGRTAETLRGAEDVRTGLFNTGTIEGMNVRFAGEDTARDMNLGAEGAMRDYFAGGAQAAAEFGTEAQNQTLTTGGNLGAQAANVTQGGAAIGQTGALGAAGILSNDWQTKYNADNNKANSGGGNDALMGAIVGGLSAFSDRRLKENVEEIGEYEPGLKIYAFNYIWDNVRRIGLMADEVIRKYPRAVSENAEGYKIVNYGLVGV